MIKHILLFFYYCYALQWPVHDVYIFSFKTAWGLADIAKDSHTC